MACTSPTSPQSSRSTRTPTSPTSPQSLQSSGSVEDLLRQLDATSARGREQAKLRQTPGPRIPHLHDNQDIEWRPLPKLDEVRHLVQGGASRRFNNNLKQAGSAVSTEPAYLHPKALDIWRTDRVVMPDRSFTYPKGNYKPPRFHHQSEPLPEPTDELLDESHALWMNKHNKEREGHQYPIVRAMDRVADYQRMYEVHREMREKTVDVLGRMPGQPMPGSPKLNENMKRGLATARGLVATKRVWNKMQGIDCLKDAETESMRKLNKAKSAPVLQHIAAVPQGRLTHLRRFQYTTVGIRDLRTSTPWQHEDETEDLKMFRKTR